MAFSIQDFYDGKVPKGGIMAAYLRYSSKNQDETSVDDQLRRCREIAAREGYNIPPEFVFTDKAISGRSMKNRPGLQRLLGVVRQNSSSVQGVIIFDTARLARNVEELLHLCKILKHYGVFLRVATSGLDSRLPGFDLVLMMLGSMDEKFVETLAENIFKGQEGQARRGYNPGGTRYGYRNVPDEHPTEFGLHGRRKVLGSHEVMVPEQAKIVLLIFSLYASGWGIDKIASHLNFNGIASPGKPRKNPVSCWAPFTIRGMLRNKIYIGQRVWGKYKKVKNPETGRTEKQIRPEDQRTVYEDQSLKIVPTDLWEKVQTRIRQVEEKRGPSSIGGMNRTERSRTYIFSMLYCSMCKGKMIAASGSGDRLRYVCGLHRGHKCSNGLTILRSSLERQLMDRIVHQLRSQEFVDLILKEFERQASAELEAEAAKLALVQNRREELLQEHASLRRKIDFYEEEIGNGFDPETIRTKHRICVSRKEEIEQLLRTEGRPGKPKIDRSELRGFLQANFHRLAEVLLADPAAAKVEMLNRIDKLWLKPDVRDGKKVYVVTGDLRLFSGINDVLLPKPLEGFREQCIGLKLSLNDLVLETQTPEKAMVRYQKESTETEGELLGKPLPEIDTAAVLAGALPAEPNLDDARRDADSEAASAGGYEYRAGFGGLRLATTWQPIPNDGGFLGRASTPGLPE
jgi:site-specific DNA recombinase